MPKLRILCLFVSALLLGAAAGAAQELEVSGSVSDPRGDGLAGATVELRPLLPAHRLAELQLSGQPGPQAALRTRTDSGGAFRLDAPAAGFWTVVVRHPDYLPAAQDLSPLLAGRRLDDLRMQRRSELAARLTDDEDRPIAGVALWVAGWSQQWRAAVENGWRPLERVVRTGPDGLAALPCASAEEVTVAALHQDRFLYREVPCEAGLVALAFDAELRDARLTFASGTPAVAAHGSFRWPTLAFGTSDEEGVVRGPFAGPEAVPVAFADASGYYGEPRWLAPAEDGEKVDDGEPVLRLSPAVSLSGRAVDAFDGTPVGGVWLWVGSGNRTFQAVERGAFGLRMPAPGKASGGARVPVMLSFGGPGYLRVAYQPPAAGTDDLVVKLIPLMTLPGRVVDARGDGIAEARVTGWNTHMAFSQRRPTRAGGIWQLDPVAAVTAGDGSFELRRLPPQRRFELRVERPGFATHFAAVPALQPGVPVPELVITLERGVTGSGLVVNEREMPIIGAEVALLPSLTGAAAEQNYDVKENHRATTGAGGRFTLRDLPAGRFYLSAKATGFPELLVPGIEIAGQDAGVDQVDLGTAVLVPGVVVSGRVTSAGGEPVAAAQLSLRNADGEQIVVQRADSLWFASTTSRQNGSFHLDGMPRDSRLVLLVSADGFLPRELALTTGEEDQRLEVELSRGARVAGVVLDPVGRPAPGARVDVTAGPELQRMNTSTSRTVEVDGEGRFEAPGLRPGDYTLAARHLNAESEPQRLRVPPEGVSDLYLELRRKAALSVTVRDPRGEPVAGVMVFLMAEPAADVRESPRPSMQRTDTRGVAVLGPLDAGTHRLTARHRELGTAEAQLEIEAGSERQFELRFEPIEDEEEARLEVSGRVTDPAGLPVSGVRTELVGVRGQGTQSGPGGEFSLAAPAGEYRLSCSHPRFATYSGEPFTLGGDGVSGMVVELSAGAIVTGRISGLEPSDLARLAITARGPYRKREGTTEFPGRRYGTVDFAGELRIEGLGAGEWIVRAELLNPTRSASERIEVAGDGAGGGILRVDLDFAEGHRLTGSVLGPVGPVAGCTVAVSCTAEFRGRTFTGGDGRFAFDHLPEGRCFVSATDAEGGRSSRQQLEIVVDTEVVLEIRPTDGSR